MKDKKVNFKNKVPIGRTVMVKNSLLNRKSKNACERRTHVVIEINQDDLALVRLTTKKDNATKLKFYKDGKTYFKHFVEIEDVNKKPLRIGPDIQQNHKNMDLSNDNVKYIIKTIANSKQKNQYNKKIKEFRLRNKKS